MVTLNINGEGRRVDAADDTPLLWVLRDTLDLVATKFGCGGGFCGACTVHIDGQPRRACITRIGDVASARITTIEGLSPHGTHPVQRAWEELDVPQCGYCQAGQIMTAAALLARTPNPSDEQIAAAMSATLCRCGTYLRVRDALIVEWTTGDFAGECFISGPLQMPAQGRVVVSQVLGIAPEKVHVQSRSPVDSISWATTRIFQRRLRRRTIRPRCGVYWLRLVRMPFAKGGFELTSAL